MIKVATFLSQEKSLLVPENGTADSVMIWHDRVEVGFSDLIRSCFFIHLFQRNSVERTYVDRATSERANDLN